MTMSSRTPDGFTPTALAIESGASVTIDAESGYIDTSDVDAECADMIIQFALFGDLVFG